MKKFAVIGSILLVGLLLVGPARADKAAEVKALVQAGVNMVKAKGVQATLKATGDSKGPFIKGDLYLFAGSLDKVTSLAHPYKAKEIVGKGSQQVQRRQGNPALCQNAGDRKWSGQRLDNVLVAQAGREKAFAQTSLHYEGSGRKFVYWGRVLRVGAFNRLSDNRTTGQNRSTDTLTSSLVCCTRSCCGCPALAL